MTAVLGVDSGGTKTLAALVGRDGTVIRVFHGPSLDPVSVPDWPQRLAGLVTDVTAAAPGLAAAVLGLPYHSEIADISAEQDRLASSLLPCPTLVDNDVRIAFDGAFAGGAGGLILAGTGSMAWASLAGPGDAHHRAGGWGEVFGDEGSAFWIGREALADASRELDGRLPASGFSTGLLAAMNVSSDRLLDWLYAQEHRRSAIAGLARAVATMAASDDPVAKGILHRAGDELAETLLAAWRKAAGEAPLRWSYAGGVTTNPQVLSRIAERIGSAPIPCRLPPVGGAALRAARLAGWEVSETWLDRLAESLSEALA